MIKAMNQLTLNFSKYNELYEMLIEKENIWREIKEKVDLSFVYEELKGNYLIVLI